MMSVTENKTEEDVAAKDRSCPMLLAINETASDTVCEMRLLSEDQLVSQSRAGTSHS